MKSTPILNTINSPNDLKRLSGARLQILASEIRSLIMQVVSVNGGHLSSNLGTVELTLALHRVFNSPKDKIVWDVGHQSYTHKLITGRRKEFHTLRKLGGISGFPKRSESPHDIIETGHASTSLSSSLGILIGQKLLSQNGKVIAVIGDGALTGGMALEALNQAGQMSKDFILVLNDNEMSIGLNVGAISSYLSRLTATKLYQSFRRKVDSAVKQIPRYGPKLISLIYRFKMGLKALLFKDSLFSHFGFEYVGPVDGHNIRLLIKTFQNIEKLDKPVVVHVTTIKGKGYIHAEGDPTLYHGVSPFSIIDGKIEYKNALTFTEAFSGIIAKLGGENEKIVGITAAMADGTGLRLFQTMYPERFFDVGIAEQHAVTFASGLAAVGLKPVVAIYSTFMQRAVDQVIHDVALPGLPVIFALDRAGFVGPDGETHQGFFDIPLFRSVPGLTIMAPANRKEMELMFNYALELQKPVMIRYTKCVCGPEMQTLSSPLEKGRGTFIRRKHGEVLLINMGGLISEILSASKILNKINISTDIYNLRFIRPLDVDFLMYLVSQYELVCLCEEGYVQGGLGEYISSTMRDYKVDANFLHLGIPERFVPQGSRSELLELYGMDAVHIAGSVEQALLSHSAVSYTLS